MEKAAQLLIPSRVMGSVHRHVVLPEELIALRLGKTPQNDHRVRWILDRLGAHSAESNLEETRNP